MKGKHIVAITMTIGFAGCVSVYGAVKAGDNELNFSGSYNNTKTDNGNHVEVTSANIGLGHFFTDELELGMISNYTHVSDLDIFGLGANGKFHFRTNDDVIPYLGGQALITEVDPDDGDNDTGIMYGPLAGLKFTPTESVILFTEYQLQFFTGDVNDSLDNNQAILAGIAFKF